ncbi:MAG: molecular chaperone [Betaproteobacteria bacterium]
MKAYICFALIVMWLVPVRADMVIERTRVVYPEGRRDVQISLSNTSTGSVAFVQLWLDDGTDSPDIESMAVPFLLSPPTARVPANGRQTVRLAFTGEPQKADQESLFYFNMLELPPRYTGPDDESRMTFARRTRIKVFFRPKGLKGDLLQAMKQLQCAPINTAGSWALECYNPSPFHLSFFSFGLGNSTTKLLASRESGMIKPSERRRFPVENYEQLPQTLSALTVEFIDDAGISTPMELTLKAAP